MGRHGHHVESGKKLLPAKRGQPIHHVESDVDSTYLFVWASTYTKGRCTDSYLLMWASPYTMGIMCTYSVSLHTKQV
jgi:hypothetical protein